DAEIQENGELHTRMCTNSGNEEEAGKEGPADGSQGIDSVDPSHIAPDLSGSLYDNLHHARKGGADEERGEEHGRTARQELGYLDESDGGRDPEHSQEELRYGTEHGEHRKGGKANAGLQRPEDPGLDGSSPRHPGEQRAAESDPHQEGD